MTILTILITVVVFDATFFLVAGVLNRVLPKAK